MKASDDDSAALLLIDTAASRLWVEPGYEASVRALGVLEPERFATLCREHARSQQGRGGSAVVPLNTAPSGPGTPQALHVRRFLHGGLLARLLGDAWLGPERAHRELRATRNLHRRGAPVPRAVFALGQRRTWPLWRIAAATLRIPDAQAGDRFLAARPSRARIDAASRAAGAAIRRLHDLGARHPDLHVANLLIHEQDASRVWIVDLDRVCVRPDRPPSPAQRARELTRLYRSLVKRGLLERVGPRGLASFLAGYTSGDRALRCALRARLPRERLRVAIHRLGYRDAARHASGSALPR